MGRLAFLTARPIAHRGLHHADKGIIENTRSAFEAAIAGGFAIECDLQLSKDGEIVVFHDDTLERLTNGKGPVCALSVAALKKLTVRGCKDRIMTLGELLALVQGRTALFLEIKSAFDGAPGCVERLVPLLADYQGDVAVMSFDPKVLEGLIKRLPRVVRGIVAEVFEASEEWPQLTDIEKVQFTHLMHAWYTQPDFVAYNVDHLPCFAAMSWKALTNSPILTWTVRTAEQREKAARWADQVIFEGDAP